MQVPKVAPVQHLNGAEWGGWGAEGPLPDISIPTPLTPLLRVPLLAILSPLILEPLPGLPLEAGMMT